MNPSTNKPNFFIVGAAKAGTTSVYDYLCQHPEIYMSPIKEPHFFSNDIREKNFKQTHYKKNNLDLKRYFSQRPLAKKHIAFIEDLAQYECLFDEASGQKIIGETSTGYLYSQTAAKNIAEYNPDAKILIILRDPVDRAYSHWKMNVSAGTADINSTFITTICNDYQQTHKGWGVSNLYIELGLYFEQINRYKNFFPVKNIKILLYEDLSQDPKTFMKEIFEHLDIKNISLNMDNKSNVSARPRFIHLFNFIKRLNLTQHTPKIMKKCIKPFLTVKSFPRPTLKEKKWLYENYFKNDIKNLECLLTTDLSKWKYSE